MRLLDWYRPDGAFGVAEGAQLVAARRSLLKARNTRHRPDDKRQLAAIERVVVAAQDAGVPLTWH